MSEAVYEKNKRLLSMKYPKIANLLDAHEKNTSVQVMPAKDNLLTMSVIKNNSPIFLHSKYKPLEEAKRWAEAFSISERAVVALFGLGLGYHVFEMMKALKEENILIAYEPDIDIFSETIRHMDLHEIIECRNVALVVGDEDDIKGTMEFYTTWSSLNNTIIKCIPSYPGIFQDEYARFSKDINDVIRQRNILKNTIISFARDWQYNLFKNIPYAFQSHMINSFYDSFTGRPAIIVSAGPSLNKNVRLLNEIKEKAVIICVDTALKVLLKENITPHFIVTIDGKLINYEKFKSIKYNDIPLVYTPKCYYEILRNHTGEKVLFSSSDDYVRLLMEKHFGIQLGTLESGGSVANNACSFARKLGADPIIFIGQDLAYTNNRSHADGSMYDGKNDIDTKKQYMQVEGIDGKPVSTNGVFYVFKQWFEKTIKEDDSGRGYINATEGGAKIEGAEITTFREAIDKYCREDINASEVIQKIFANKNVVKKDVLLEIIRAYNENIKQLDYIMSRCKEGSNQSLMLFNSFTATRRFDINSTLKRLDQIDKEIKKKKEKFELIVYIIQPILFVLNEYLGTREFESDTQKGMHIAKTSKILYDGMKEAVELVKPWIKECIIELEELSLNTKEDGDGLES